MESEEGIVEGEEAVIKKPMLLKVPLLWGEGDGVKGKIKDEGIPFPLFPSTH